MRATVLDMNLNCFTATDRFSDQMKAGDCSLQKHFPFFPRLYPTVSELQIGLVEKYTSS